MSYFTLTPIESVLQMQQRFWAALQNQSAEEFESVLAENYRCVSPLHADQGRAEFIHTLVSIPVTVESVTCDNLQVDVWDNVAVLTGIQISRLSLPNGASVKDKIAITNIFHRIGEDWKMVLSHAVALPDAE
ncbi:MAG: nuclear transport factor 2 family protein [Chloroflexi bacterium]|nr:nuclear transport factor 2 family protein [Chloroflexota bacterium]